MFAIKGFIDIAANLTDPMYKGIYNGTQKHEADLVHVLSRAWKQGLEKIIITGTSLKESEEGIQISTTDERLFCTVGCHPTMCNEFDKEGRDKYLQGLSDLVERNKDKVVAIGECGLDYDRLQFCARETQLKYFEWQLELAKEWKLPLFLHCRNAAEDVAKVLNKQRDKLFGGVVHSFDGTKEEADRFLAMGYYIGINGCSLKTPANLEVVKTLPLNRLLLETDAPWCEIRPSHAGHKHVKTCLPSVKKEKWSPESVVKSRNEPANIVMYEKDRTLQLLTSASAIPNNLAVSCFRNNKVADSIAVIHQGFINVVPVVGEELSAKYIPCTDSTHRQSATVTQVMWCTLGLEPVLIITSSQGLQVFDAEGLECRFSHPCEDPSPSPPAETFARGLATVCDEFLCVGNASGCVRVFGVLGEEMEIVFVDRKQEHSEAITDLAANKELLVSADEGGSVVLWTLTGEELLKAHHLPDYGSSCTSLKLLDDLLLAVYGSGHLRLFTVSGVEPRLLCEVAAHAHWPTALDVAPAARLALTVSEDSFIRVWEIVRGDRTIIKQKFFTRVEDAFLVGARFLTSDGSAFCVSAYDSNLVYCFKS